jgi:large subunit ribosomal protein L35
VIIIKGKGNEMAKAKAKIKVKTKLKTNQSAAKRFKITGSGKVMRRKGWKGHLLSGKNATRKRRLSGDFEVTKDSRENIQQMLPYGLK